jgi:hypothetical protein
MISDTEIMRELDFSSSFRHLRSDQYRMLLFGFAMV